MDLDSDSDDSSDMDCMLKDAVKRHNQFSISDSAGVGNRAGKDGADREEEDDSSSSEDDCDDGSSDDDDDDEVYGIGAQSSRSSRRKREKKIKERERQNRRMKSKLGSDDDDSDDDDLGIENKVQQASTSSEEVQVVVVPPPPPPAAAAPAGCRRSARLDKSRVQVGVAVTTAEEFAAGGAAGAKNGDVAEELSSDDEDVIEINDSDEDDSKPAPALSAASKAKLESLRKAAANLGSNRFRSDDIIVDARNSSGSAGASHSYINLTVRSRICKFGTEPENAVTTHRMGNFQDFNTLKASILQTLDIKPGDCVINLAAIASRNGTATTTTTLRMTRHPRDYDLVDGSEIQATINLTGLSAFKKPGANNRNGIVGGSSAGAAENLGRKIKVTLRRVDNGGQPRECGIRFRQPFQALVDDYCQKEGISGARGKGKVVLKFDGEKLSLDKTPASVDMDDEDLIDVVILP